jgi:hypothetical protein
MAVGHDFGLALIYGSVLGAWLFPLSFSALDLLIARTPASLIALALAAAAACLCIRRLCQIDHEEQLLYNLADHRDRAIGQGYGEPPG